MIHKQLKRNMMLSKHFAYTTVDLLIMVVVTTKHRFQDITCSFLTVAFKSLVWSRAWSFVLVAYCYQTRQQLRMACHENVNLVWPPFRATANVNTGTFYDTTQKAGVKSISTPKERPWGEKSIIALCESCQVPWSRSHCATAIPSFKRRNFKGKKLASCV